MTIRMVIKWCFFRSSNDFRIPLSRHQVQNIQHSDRESPRIPVPRKWFHPAAALILSPIMHPSIPAKPMFDPNNNRPLQHVSELERACF